MKFLATDRITGEEHEITEAEVRAEIIDMFQHDMPTCAEYSDDEIAHNINASDLLDHFNNNLFEGRNFDIKIV